MAVIVNGYLWLHPPVVYAIEDCWATLADQLEERTKRLAYTDKHYTEINHTEILRVIKRGLFDPINNEPAKMRKMHLNRGDLSKIEQVFAGKDMALKDKLTQVVLIATRAWSREMPKASREAIIREVEEYMRSPWSNHKGIERSNYDDAIDRINIFDVQPTPEYPYDLRVTVLFHAVALHGRRAHPTITGQEVVRRARCR